MLDACYICMFDHTAPASNFQQALATCYLHRFNALSSTCSPAMCHCLQGQAAYLSHTAVTFLTAQYEKRAAAYARQHGGAPRLPVALLLEDDTADCLFHCAPPSHDAASHPLGADHVRELMYAGADTGMLSLEAFLAIWVFCALLDPRKVAAALLYLGFPDTYRCAMSRPVGRSVAARGVEQCCPVCFLL